MFTSYNKDTRQVNLFLKHVRTYVKHVLQYEIQERLKER